MSSESALQIPTEMIHYGMTETEQLAVARGLAESLAGTKVTVNSVLPGPTASVVYVCSAVASTTTGAAVRVDGGVVRAIV